MLYDEVVSSVLETLFDSLLTTVVLQEVSWEQVR